MDDRKLLIGSGSGTAELLLPYANRHGLIAGATGTGKTVTLQSLAEGFSRAGVPVFCADVKGDLAGLACAGTADPRIEARVAELGLQGFTYAPSPVIFWDLEGARGHPIRATVAEMGPVLLARMLELNETQEGVLAIAFALADTEGLLLLAMKDLSALLQSVAERAGELTKTYGHVAKATIGTIQRRLLALEQQGGDRLFGEPALALRDLMLKTPDGRGAINLLVADRLMSTPRLYSTFLLWLLSELFEELPEIGDPPAPELVFFFDEAHLLFRDAPKGLLTKIEQVVRLIRSKGVGVYFVTQNPQDVPPTVLAQLGNRVQHALRAYTPQEAKAVRTAAETFRPNPKLDVARAITELGVGEALVSALMDKGIPSVVEQVKVAPPRSRLGPVSDAERNAVLGHSPIGGKYEAVIDRASAYERLAAMAGSVDGGTAVAEATSSPADGKPWGGARTDRSRERPPAAPRRREPAEREPSLVESLVLGRGKREGLAEAMTKSVVRSISSQVGSQLGRAVVRGILGSIARR